MHGHVCIESNPFQQGWFIQYDISGFLSLIGGRKKIASKLECFMEKTPGLFL